MNIEDKELLIDEARWFDNTKPSGVAVLSISAMQSGGASTNQLTMAIRLRHITITGKDISLP